MSRVAVHAEQYVAGQLSYEQAVWRTLADRIDRELSPAYYAELLRSLPQVAGDPGARSCALRDLETALRRRREETDFFDRSSVCAYLSIALRAAAGRDVELPALAEVAEGEIAVEEVAS